MKPLVYSLLLFAIVLDARADEFVLIKTSPELEKSVSHIVVGQLKAYHGLKADPHRFVAEVEVTGVEKGEGITPGSRVFVRFHSPMTKEQLGTDRSGWGCGAHKIEPLPGEYLRVYMVLNDDYEYVADHPQCFFALNRVKSNDGPGLTVLIPSVSSLALLPGGFLAGWVICSKRSKISPRVTPAATD